MPLKNQTKGLKIQDIAKKTNMNGPKFDPINSLLGQNKMFCYETFLRSFLTNITFRTFYAKKAILPDFQLKSAKIGKSDKSYVQIYFHEKRCVVSFKF